MCPECLTGDRFKSGLLNEGLIYYLWTKLQLEDTEKVILWLDFERVCQFLDLYLNDSQLLERVVSVISCLDADGPCYGHISQF